MVGVYWGISRCNTTFEVTVGLGKACMVYVWSMQLSRITNYCSLRVIELLTPHILVSAYQETSVQVAKRSMIRETMLLICFLIIYTTMH